MDTTPDFYTLNPDAILDAVESIGYLPDGRFLALNSYENRVYQVGIEDAEPIVAKFYRPRRWSNEAILEEHSFTLALEAEEIPVVSPLVIDGNTLLEHAEHRFALYPRRGGRAPDLDDDDLLEQFGRFIGRIHQLGRTRPFEHRPALNVETFGRQPANYLLANDFIPADLIAAYESLSSQLITLAETRFDEVAASTLRLHGDCHPGNILARDEHLHIVDFDDARSGPAVQDLWMFLSGERQYQQLKLSALLEGYSEFAEFDPAELGLIEALRTLRIIHYAGWLAQRADDPAFQLAFPWFGSQKYWEEHILSLREQYAAMEEPALKWL